MPLMAKILIVEDQNIVALDIQNRLKSLNYVVTGTASSGAGAVKKAEETKPDLVLMDIMLKGDMDGVEAAEEIRYRFGIPVVYLTAYADSNTLQRAKITEPFGYILKPFQEKELQSTIEMALYRHKMENQLKEREVNFYNTLKSLDQGIIITDIKGNINFINSIVQDIFGWNFRTATKENMNKVLNLENPEINLKDLSQIKKFNKYTVKNKDKNNIDISLKVLQIINEDNELSGFVIILNKIIDQNHFLQNSDLADIFNDINNNLTTISANISVILANGSLNNNYLDLLKQVEDSSFSISKIIKSNM